MFRICSATGLTTGANEDITIAIRQQTELKDKDVHLFPFMMRKLNLICDKSTSVFFNTDDTIITAGLNATILRDSGNGDYVVATDLNDIAINKITIAQTGISWIVTFVY